MADYLNDYAAEHGYTLEVDEQPAGGNRWISTATLIDAAGEIFKEAKSDPLHSERPQVIILICHEQALKRLLDIVVEYEREQIRAIPADTFEEFIEATEKKPKRTKARKIVEDGDA